MTILWGVKIPQHVRLHPKDKQAKKALLAKRRRGWNANGVKRRRERAAEERGRRVSMLNRKTKEAVKAS